jgi:DNA-binding NtrC family response regulator
VGVEHLSPRLRGDGPTAAADAAEPAASGSAGGPAPGPQLREARAAFEARHIAEVLRQQGGNVSRAAVVLGLSRMQLHRKLKEYGIR